MKPQQSRIGGNRTGVQMSALDAREMKHRSEQSLVPPAHVPVAAALSDMRARYVAEAPQLGSLPPPATVRGVLQAGAALLAGNSQQLLLDKLGERLAFERSSARLYDSLVVKLRATQGDDGDELLPMELLLRIRDQEVEHFALLAHAIDRLGGDSTAQTPGADLAGVESAGLLQAVADPRSSVLQSLHAVLIAEMADHHGWELLFALASAQKRDSLRIDFQLAAQQEAQHLQYVKSWIERHTLGAPLAWQGV